jgi:hypothetical protein
LAFRKRLKASKTSAAVQGFVAPDFDGLAFGEGFFAGAFFDATFLGGVFLREVLRVILAMIRVY